MPNTVKMARFNFRLVTKVGFFAPRTDFILMLRQATVAVGDGPTEPGAMVSDFWGPLSEGSKVFFMTLTLEARTLVVSRGRLLYKCQGEGTW